MLLKDKRQELVHLQLETVAAALGDEASQKSLLLLTQGHFVQIRHSNKWILSKADNTLPLLLVVVGTEVGGGGVEHSFPLYVFSSTLVPFLTLLRRSIFSDLREVSSCHRATQCFRQQVLRVCKQNRKQMSHMGL